ncbi:MAG: glycosyl hydrolase [Acidobacteria bacterium]|nr:glycosyl hydrolase [Acidobacteriota bacterium]
MSRKLLPCALKAIAVLLAAVGPALAGDSRAAWHPVVDSGARLRELFANPPAEYSTSPFFVWNGDMNEAEIEQFVKSYHDQGIRSLFIHPRPGLITPYLSERWFSLVRYTVDQAAKLGMEVWLYDENSYPSGFAGGHVPVEMPESYNEGQGLVPQRLTELKPGDARKYKVILKQEGSGFRDITATAEQETGKPGSYYGFELAYYAKRAWHGGQSYVDLIRPGVTEKFIELTMRGYWKTLKGDLGHRVPGIFTDEPNINLPRGGSMRWTPDLFEQFSRRWGYDLRPQLPSLFEETGDWRKVRNNYYSLLLDLFIGRWSKPWFDYTEKNGIFWTGHYWEHGWPSPADGPDNMAMYAWHQVPGIDMLFNQFDDGVNAQFGNARAVRELASVASQMGRRRTLSETYGGAGWELRFEDMKRLGEWQSVLGVNFMNQHLSFQTLAGARKHDYPQSFSYHEPWWKHYRVLGDYFARLSLAIASGEQINRILVLEPTTSAWMYASSGQRDPRLKALGSSFQTLLNRFETMQVEYDLGSENIIKDHGKAAGGRMVVGQRSYGLVVIGPGTENLDTTTVRLLEAYLSSGGTVLSFVDPPGRVDGAVTDRMAKLAGQYLTRWVRAVLPDEPGVARFLGTEDFRLKWDPAAGGKLFHQRRQLSRMPPAACTLRVGV